jgi:signal transduction histidine kinase
MLLIVEDDGTGFDGTDTHRDAGSKGLGLIGIRERVAQLRGTFRIDSTPDAGTRLAIELPAHARDQPTEVRASAAEIGAVPCEVPGA